MNKKLQENTVCYVYGITEIKTGEVIYIGSTTNTYKRFKSHIHNCFVEDTKIPVYDYIRATCEAKKDFDKYFKFEILDTVMVNDSKTLRTYENEYIRGYKPKYNKRAAAGALAGFGSYDFKRVVSDPEYHEAWMKYQREYHRNYVKDDARRERHNEYSRLWRKRQKEEREEKIEKANSEME